MITPARTTLSLVGAAALGCMVFAAPQASAFIPVPPCTASSCVGQSPYISSQGVDCVADATTVSGSSTKAPNQGYMVVLRWSEYCEANWAQLTNGPSNTARYYVQTEDGKKGPGSGNPYSTMVDGSQLARVCVQDDAQAADDSNNCSGWF